MSCLPSTNILILTLIGTLLTACGADRQHQAATSTAVDSRPNTTASAASRVPYLIEHHAEYSDSNSAGQTPVAISINGDEIYWDIYAAGEDQANGLREHLEFMGNALDSGNIPRNWDKLFVLEAAMHDWIHTEVSQDGQLVRIHKRADNDCAVALMRIHAQAVSEEFFASGDVSTDHSAAADSLLASAACAPWQATLTAEVEANWQPR